MHGKYARPTLLRNRYSRQHESTRLPRPVLRGFLPGAMANPLAYPEASRVVARHPGNVSNRLVDIRIAKTLRSD